MTSSLLISYTVWIFNTAMSIPILLGILVVMGFYFFRVSICARLGNCLPLNLIVQSAPCTLFSRYSEESNAVSCSRCSILSVSARALKNTAEPMEHLIELFCFYFVSFNLFRL